MPFEPLIDDVPRYVGGLPWVRDSALRLREEGRFLTGTIYVVPVDGSVSPEWIEAAERDLLDLNWRIHDVSIMPRTEVPRPPTGRPEEIGPPPLRAGAMRRAES